MFPLEALARLISPGTRCSQGAVGVRLMLGVIEEDNVMEAVEVAVAVALAVAVAEALGGM